MPGPVVRGTMSGELFAHGITRRRQTVSDVDRWDLVFRRDDLSVSEVRSATAPELKPGEISLAIEKFGMTGKLPAALLADAKGTVIRRVDGLRGGRLTSAPVEKMVRDELSARGDTMYVRITEAKKRAAGGDKDGAIDLYKKLWDERCLFPLAGKEAQHALKDLGVIVVEPPPQFQIDPNLPVPGTTTTKPKPPGGH